MVMYANEVETKENKNYLRYKINCNIYIVLKSDRLVSHAMHMQPNGFPKLL